MKKVILFITLLGVLILIGFSYSMLTPDSYNSPKIKERKGTQYWNLETGSKIAYNFIPANGEKKPYPIIFLQGGPGGFISDDDIKDIGQFAKDGYDVYLYDQIGSGHSARLDDITQYTPIRHKNDLEAIVKQIKAEKVILWGQSWGAMLATLYIADNPDKVERCIFTAPGPILPINDKITTLKAPDSLNLKDPPYTNREANLKANNMRTRLISWFAITQGKKLANDSEADDFQTYLNNELNKATVTDTTKAHKAEGGGGFYAQVMTVHAFNTTPNPRQKLKNSPIPVLIVKPQYDNLKWGYLTEYLTLFPNHKLVIIPNAGHSIESEQVDFLVKNVSSFLNDNYKGLN